MKILHNPHCSKSREALAIVKECTSDFEVVEYLKTPPSRKELQEIVARLGLRPKDIVRTKEKAFASLALDLEDDEAVLTALAENPILLERPIVIKDQKAVLGRPPENVRNLMKA